MVAVSYAKGGINLILMSVPRLTLSVPPQLIIPAAVDLRYALLLSVSVLLCMLLSVRILLGCCKMLTLLFYC